MAKKTAAPSRAAAPPQPKTRLADLFQVARLGQQGAGHPGQGDQRAEEGAVHLRGGGEAKAGAHPQEAAQGRPLEERTSSRTARRVVRSSSESGLNSTEVRIIHGEAARPAAPSRPVAGEKRRTPSQKDQEKRQAAVNDADQARRP